MRKVLTGMVLIPLAVIFIVFAVANRHLTTVSFDPFNSRNPSVAMTLPLFVVIIVVAILGVAAGGVATWFRQAHWRRAARQYETEALDARRQLADLRATMASRTEAPRLLPQGGVFGSAERDKHDAAL